ncbi:MAG: hypothetical protein ACRENB_15885 [Gemmatimonadales bacterium]
MSRSLHLALLIVLAAGCTIENRPPTRETGPGRGTTEAVAAARAEAEIRAALLRYYADLTARDWRAFRQNFWPPGLMATVWQPPGRPRPVVEAVPVDTFIARAPSGPGSKPIFEERMTGLVVRSHGNLAQAWATYTARFGEPGNVATWEGLDAFTLLRHEGTWRIVSLSYTDK